MLDLNKVASLEQDSKNQTPGEYDDINNIQHMLGNKGDVSDRIIGHGMNLNGAAQRASAMKKLIKSEVGQFSEAKNYSSQAEEARDARNDPILHSLKQFN